MSVQKNKSNERQRQRQRQWQQQKRNNDNKGDRQMALLPGSEAFRHKARKAKPTHNKDKCAQLAQDT